MGGHQLDCETKHWTFDGPSHHTIIKSSSNVTGKLLISLVNPDWFLKVHAWCNTEYHEDMIGLSSSNGDWTGVYLYSHSLVPCLTYLPYEQTDIILDSNIHYMYQNNDSGQTNRFSRNPLEVVYNLCNIGTVFNTTGNISMNNLYNNFKTI